MFKRPLDPQNDAALKRATPATASAATVVVVTDGHTENDEIARYVAMAETREALDDPGNLLRRVQRLPHATKLNADMRRQHVDEPERFLESEEMLHQLLVDLHALAASPEVLEMVGDEFIVALLGLMEHENADICQRAVSFLRDTTEADGGGAVDGRESLVVWTQRLLANDALPLLLRAVQTMSVADEGEAACVFGALEFVENVLDLGLLLPQSLDGWVYWLAGIALSGEPTTDRPLGPTARFGSRDSGLVALRLFAAELLVTLVQESADIRVAFVMDGGVDRVLAAIAPFAQHDPTAGDETELVENLFDLGCTALINPAGRRAFIEADGFGFAFVLLQQIGMCRDRALKLVDYATADGDYQAATACIEAGLLKILPALLLHTHVKDGSDEQQRVISITASLFKGTQATAELKDRLVSKFIEANCEKTRRIAELRQLHLDEETLFQLDLIIIALSENSTCSPHLLPWIGLAQQSLSKLQDLGASESL